MPNHPLHTDDNDTQDTDGDDAIHRDDKVIAIATNIIVGVFIISGYVKVIFLFWTKHEDYQLPDSIIEPPRQIDLFLGHVNNFE